MRCVPCSFSPPLRNARWSPRCARQSGARWRCRSHARRPPGFLVSSFRLLILAIERIIERTIEQIIERTIERIFLASGRQGGRRGAGGERAAVLAAAAAGRWPVRPWSRMHHICGDCDRFVNRGAPPLPPPSRTNWTRLVPPPVLTGHVSSLQRGRRASRSCGHATPSWPRRALRSTRRDARPGASALRPRLRRGSWSRRSGSGRRCRRNTQERWTRPGGRGRPRHSRRQRRGCDCPCCSLTLLSLSHRPSVQPVFLQSDPEACAEATLYAAGWRATAIVREPRAWGHWSLPCSPHLPLCD